MIHSSAVPSFTRPVPSPRLPFLGENLSQPLDTADFPKNQQRREQVPTLVSQLATGNFFLQRIVLIRAGMVQVAACHV